MRKSRLVIFSIGYLPLQGYGGPVSSLYRMTQLLGDVCDIYIVTRNGDAGELQNRSGNRRGWQCVGKAKVCYLAESQWNVFAFKKFLKRIAPNCVYISSFFAARMTLPLLMILRGSKRRILISPRGELLARALSIKSVKKRWYIRLLKGFGMLRNVSFHATSDIDADSIRTALGIPDERLYQVSNIPPDISRKEYIRKEKGKLRILMASRIVPNKGILTGIRAVCNLAGDVEMDIYGNPEDPAYVKVCEAEIRNAPPNVHIKMHPAYRFDEIGDVFRQYDCCLCPTEFESYGQVIAEAVTHDCPVVLSRGVTPWDDQESAGVGYLAPYEDIDGFAKVLKKIQDMDMMEYGRLIERLRAYVEQMESPASLREQYLEMFGFAKSK